MKRTATLTFHASDNNGSFLQAFALQRVITAQCGVENTIVDFQNEKQARLYSLFRSIKEPLDLVRNAISLCHYPLLKRRGENFAAMRKKHLAMTPRFSTYEEALRGANGYDLYIAGSDQIWNTNAYDFTPAFFLGGFSGKKISFSASCGTHANKASLLNYAEELKGFSSLSVREASVAAALKKETGLSAAVHPDPTLLLDAADYDVLSPKRPLIEGDYIFMYSISYDKCVLNTAARLSRLLSIPVVTVFTGYYCVNCLSKGIKVRFSDGPAEFLNLLKNARLVVTNSFHGAAFSVIYRKDFYHVAKEEDGAIVRDDRIDDFLDALSLQRSVTESAKDEVLLSMLSVDYTGVEERLLSLRKDAVEYLKTAVSKALSSV